MSSISTTYQPDHIEKKWTKIWLQHKVGQPQPQENTYTIMIPPPNVTGTLHMGHGFQLTLMDILVRYQRMHGHQTLWQVGTDHAGIATQMVVERQLAQQKKNKHDLGREKFVDEVWAWKKKSGNTITQQMKQLGITVDWDTEQFTLDEHFNDAVNQVFVTLFREGIIYRGQRLIHWDPTLKTAVSDLEVVNVEKSGQIWTISYQLEHNDNLNISVSTTRPETIFGDMAIAVHPDDTRYQDLIGEKAFIPITQRAIPIIADPEVDPEFGTGAVKITPAHDFFDEEIAKRHGLASLSIMAEDGTLNAQVPTEYQGLDRLIARKKLVKDLDSRGCLVDTAPHKLVVPTGDRSGAVLEPFLTDQWYMKMTEMAKKALESVPRDCQFFPQQWENTYSHWLLNIQDWCISRQLWWGHQIPAWHDEKGNVYVGKNLTEIKEHYGLASTDQLLQDEDVLDTWFSSALWPMVTLGWPNTTAPRFQSHYPTDVLVTGFDILFFWVARMIMLQQKFTDQVPFKHVYITGLIKDSQGQKMSKSKGNILDPIDLVAGISCDELIKKRAFGLMQPHMQEKIIKQTKKEFPNGISAHGTDALRMTFSALASTGRDIRFDMQRLTGYRNFCNKIWNCGRFIEHQLTQGHRVSQTSEWSRIDQWLAEQINNTIEEVSKHIANYRFDLLAQTLHQFMWHKFCDWYVELKKVELKKSNASDLRPFVTMFDNALLLLHPFLPFITEELGAFTAELLGLQRTCLALAKYPTQAPCDTTNHNDTYQLISLIEGCRVIRSEMNINPKESLRAYISGAEAETLSYWQPFFENLASCTVINAPAPQGIIAHHTVGKLAIALDLTHHLDSEKEEKRLLTRQIKIEQELKKIENKITQKNYQHKAPSHIKLQDKKQHDRVTGDLKRIQHYISLIQNHSTL